MKAILIIFFTVLFGCVGIEERSASSWVVEYHLSGGFAGLRQALKVTSSGDVVASDAKRGWRTEEKADPELLTRIEAVLRALPAQAPTPPGPTRCRDCLRVEITVTNADQVRRIVFDQGAPVDPAFARLAGVMAQVRSELFPRPD